MWFFLVFVIMIVSIIIISNMMYSEFTFVFVNVLIVPFFILVFIFCGVFLNSVILDEKTNLEIMEADKKSNVEINENLENNENNIKSEKEEVYIDSKSIEIDKNIDEKTDEEKLKIIFENLEETYNYLREQIYQSDEISSELKIEIENYNKDVKECLSYNKYRMFQDLAIIELDIIQK